MTSELPRLGLAEAPGGWLPSAGLLLSLPALPHPALPHGPPGG